MNAAQLQQLSELRDVVRNLGCAVLALNRLVLMTRKELKLDCGESAQNGDVKPPDKKLVGESHEA